MKLLLLLTFIGPNSFAKSVCEQQRTEISEDVVYEVSKDIPEYLKGAKITTTLSNGKSSTVPAEQFMLVKRKQYTVVGKNQTIVERNNCLTTGSKNNLILEARKDVKGLKTETVGSTSKVYSEKEFIPGVNYYRQDLYDLPIGAGLGVDSNGTVKGMLGIGF